LRRARFDPTGKIALITGGGTGIGRGIALALARRGAHVALVGRRPEPLLATAAAVAALGGRALPIPLDITDAATRRLLLPAICAELGGLDILVHNAGVLAGGPLAARSDTEINQALQTNLTAAIDLTRLAQADLVRRRGALVFVGSAMAFVPMPQATLYAASKAGLHGFAQAIRYELEPAGVRVLATYPPGTATELLNDAATALTQRRRVAELRRENSSYSSLARRVSVLAYRLEDPERTGERIVAALATGRRTLVWGGERWLIGLHHVAPRLVESALMRLRKHFVW
jgi:NAD(P)-dependent dehydrogenase (short-subunit alcohol dehydrogenase family)